MGNWSVLADSGSLFAATDPKDLHHARALRDLHRPAEERRVLAVPYPILWECHPLLIRRLGVSRAGSWLADVRGSAVFVAPSLDDSGAAMQRPARYPDQTITLFDAVLAVMSDRFKIPVRTFDHHFDVMRVAVRR